MRFTARSGKKNTPLILSEFNKVYCSSQIGARKPAAEAYERVLQDAGLKPEDAVFVDDIEAKYRRG